MLTNHAAALALLADPSYHVVTAPDTGAASGVAWLRSHVSRFATGETHRRRRGLVEQRLTGLDLGALRRHAAELSTVESSAGAVTVRALASALGIAGDVAPLVAAIAPCYFPSTAVTAAADAAVDALVALLGDASAEAKAATIAILVQAHDATAALVTAARDADLPGVDVEALLAETLRHDPPVAQLWRVGADGERVGIDVRAANRDPAVFADPETFDPRRTDAAAHLTFGAGLRPCPGQAHALVIAAGILAGRPTARP